MKVLIVDDNKDITEMLSRYLKVKGIDCASTNDPLNGLTLIKKEKYDNVFLDMSMPGFSGLDIINALEKEDLLKNQKVVIFTASSISNDEIQKLLEKDGVDSCLRKPVELKDLLATINSET